MNVFELLHEIQTVIIDFNNHGVKACMCKSGSSGDELCSERLLCCVYIILSVIFLALLNKFITQKWHSHQGISGFLIFSFLETTDRSLKWWKKKHRAIFLCNFFQNENEMSRSRRRHWIRCLGKWVFRSYRIEYMIVSTGCTSNNDVMTKRLWEP